MIFIRSRENQRREKRNRRAPRKGNDQPAQSTKDQAGENRVFRDVRRFSHQEMNLRDRERRKVRFKPAEQRREEVRGVVRGEEIGRTEKHERQPQNDWTPGLEQSAKLQSRSLASATRLTNQPTRASFAADVDLPQPAADF